MNWLHYLLEANLYLVVFYTGYCLFLTKETYYTLNRVYLLVSCILSFLLPVIQIGALKPAELSGETVVFIVSNGTKTVETQAITDHITYDAVLVYAYLLGVAVLALVLLFKIFRLIKMTRATGVLVHERYKLIGVNGSNTAFSFFNYLFIGSGTTGSDTIIRHELVHIRQKHSADIIFLELMKIINWFNPFIYLLQVSLKTVHEYIADEQTAALEPDALTYSSFLVNNAYGLNGSSVTHSFFNYNLLKKRIIMLNQKRSGNLARLKYLLAVPICAAALCASTLGFSKTYALIDLAPRHHTEPTAHYKGANISTDTTQRVINTNQVTSKGYKYEEEGYLINGQTDFRVIITEKNGEQSEYYKHSAKPADLAMLKNKYGYSFPKMLIYPKLPPPPPTPGPKSVVKKTPPPPPLPPAKVKKRVKVIDVVLLPPPTAPEKPVEPAKEPAEQKVPPPPPPKDPFDSLYKYIAKHVRYPAVAREKRIAGRVIFNFNINNGKIENLKIVRSLYADVDAEIVRVIKNFNSTLGIKSGRYAIPVSLNLVDQNNNYVGKAPDNNKTSANITVQEQGTINSLNEVVIVGYVNSK